MMKEKILELYSTEQIAERVKTLAADISQFYAEHDLIILSTQESCFVFLADLLRQMTIHPRTGFLRFTQHSFGLLRDLSFTTEIDLRKKEVLLITGVLETGVPQDYLMRQLTERGANNIKLCTLLNKNMSRRVELQPDWFAFETNEDYVFGYGLGFQERFRELPFLARVKREADEGRKARKSLKKK